MSYNATFFVEQLQMLPHPEGGWYKETYRSSDLIPATGLPTRFAGERAASTAIYFLLEHHHFSAFHRIKSDEVWHFYYGGPLDVYVLQPDGSLEIIRVGNNPAEGEVFQAVVKAGCWFASKPAKPHTFSLVGCTVAPGFDFADFELADKNKLAAEFPAHEQLIRKLCR